MIALVQEFEVIMRNIVRFYLKKKKKRKHISPFTEESVLRMNKHEIYYFHYLIENVEMVPGRRPQTKIGELQS